MTDTEFQTLVLEKLSSLEGKVDSLEGKMDSLEIGQQAIRDDLAKFQNNQDEYSSAIWNLNNQAFQSINEIRSEVLPPWKARKNITP